MDPNGNILFIDRRVESYVRKLQPANIFPREVVNSATAQPGFLAPGELVTIYWADLGQPTPVTANPVGGRYPVELSGVQVKFDGQAAYVHPLQRFAPPRRRKIPTSRTNAIVRDAPISWLPWQPGGAL